MYSHSCELSSSDGSRDLSEGLHLVKKLRVRLSA